jgi:hypothetical protein
MVCKRKHKGDRAVAPPGLVERHGAEWPKGEGEVRD